MNYRRPEKGATIRTRGVLHPFRVHFCGWPVTQGAAPGFALHSALGYFLLPFQGSGNVQSPGSPSGTAASGPSVPSGKLVGCDQPLGRGVG